jgi:hypothetical protein
MAEMETYHAQKNEDFRTLTVEHLDGEIGFYEQVRSHSRPIDTWKLSINRAIGINPT